MIRKRWQSSKVWLFIISLVSCGFLILLSSVGFLAPIENLAELPLLWMNGFLNQIAISSSEGITDFAQLRDLRARNAALEEALARFQTELVELREIENDYKRLTELLDYRDSRTAQQFLTADVIGVDQSGQRRSIVINRGSRDGVANGMPVVTGQGLVGRVVNVASTFSRVLLITDPTSAVSVRVQNSRVEGSIIGQLSGSLLLTFIPLDADLNEGDLIITSGVGGNFPADIAIGQVTSVRQFQFELFQEGQVRSLIDFDTLEFVLVITSFEPIDLNVFEEAEEAN